MPKTPTSESGLYSIQLWADFTAETEEEAKELAERIFQSLSHHHLVEACQKGSLEYEG